MRLFKSVNTRVGAHSTASGTPCVYKYSILLTHNTGEYSCLINASFMANGLLCVEALTLCITGITGSANSTEASTLANFSAA